MFPIKYSQTVTNTEKKELISFDPVKVIGQKFHVFNTNFIQFFFLVKKNMDFSNQILVQEQVKKKT